MGIGSIDFQGLWKRRRELFPVVFSMDRHFLDPLVQPLVLRGESQFLEQLAFGLLHAACCFGIAEGSGDSLQGVDTESLAQILCRFIQRQQGLQRSLVALVANAFAALLIDLDVGLGAGTMVVQIGIEILPIEAVDAVGVARIDVAVADVFTNHRAVLGLYKTVVAALPGAAFGLFDQQLVEQFGDGAIDELAAVVGVKALDAKGELAQHGLEHRLQIGFRDARRRADHLPLQDFIDGVDVINALGSATASRLIALMHRIQAQIAGLALRIGLAPLADRDRRGPRLDVVQTPLAVTLALAQVVQMSHRDPRQTRILLLAVELNLAFQDAPRRRPAQGLVRLIDRGQQLDVGPRVALRKTAPPVNRRLDTAREPCSDAISRVTCARLNPVIFSM